MTGKETTVPGPTSRGLGSLVEPAEQVAPAEPVEQVEPGEPVQPVEPADRVEPVEPVEPVETSGTPGRDRVAAAPSARTPSATPSGARWVRRRPGRHLDQKGRPGSFGRRDLSSAAGLAERRRPQRGVDAGSDGGFGPGSAAASSSSTAAEGRGSGLVDQGQPRRAGTVRVEVARGERRDEVGDRGAGTILVLAGVSVLLLVGVLAFAIAGAAVLHTRAAGAADLAALAGASAALGGSDGACARASEVAAANGSTLKTCRLTGSEVWVEVSVPTPQELRRILRAPPFAQARAHAVLVARDPGTE